MTIDLDAILAVADAYEARKKAMTEAGALKDPAYLATLAEGEAAKAFEALRPLVARVRELERQRELLAHALGRALTCSGCWLKKSCPDYMDGPSLDVGLCAKHYIEWVEQAAKEAGK